MQAIATGNVPSLKARGVRRMGMTLLSVAAMLFVPAGSWRFWQGWVYLLLMMGFWSYFFLHFLKHDPQLAERRLQSKEPELVQKVILKLFSVFLCAGFIVAGLDFRFGWSRPGLVRDTLIVAGQSGVVAGYWLVFWVMKTNSYAASVIQVESGQRVIDSGPYALVRHPMYTGMSLTSVATPLALGSYVALPVFVCILPLLVYRLIHEERTLCRDLPGYSEYCQRAHFRIVPFVW